MIEPYNMEIGDETLKSMIEINPEITELTNQEIIKKVEILKEINCSKTQILSIIISNPLFLSRGINEIIKLLSYLQEIGFTCLNILFDSNPYILNLEPFEIKKYINNRINQGENLDDIVDDLDSNPYLFQEI
ncbi:MAG: hypothetical protein K6G37_01465 [Bacilli bacterium]|nr:hypothetical protein [Bacilli bacterium]